MGPSNLLARSTGDALDLWLAAVVVGGQPSCGAEPIPSGIWRSPQADSVRVELNYKTPSFSSV